MLFASTLLLLLVHLHSIFGLDDLKYSKVITVNFNGSNDAACCGDGHCPCSSLESALDHIRNDNTLINITSLVVPLLSLVNITGYTTIGISGNDGMVISCNNTGGVSFVNCKNIDISGITWDQCGGSGLAGAVSMEQSSDITIHNCTFQQSYTYGVAILNASAMVAITYTKFLKNNAGLFFYQTHHPSAEYTLDVVIANSIFEHNGESFGACGGLKIHADDQHAVISVSISNSHFFNNSAFQGGAIYLHAEIESIKLQITGVHVEKNSALVFTEIYCYTKGNNAVLNAKESVFMNNLFLQFSSLNVSLSITNSAVGLSRGAMQLYVETFSKYLFSNFCALNFTRTKVKHQVRKYPSNCILRFDEIYANYNTSLQVDGKESHGFQCYITNCVFSNNSNGIPVVDILNYNLPNNHPNIHATIQIINTTFSGNSNGTGVVHLVYDGQNDNPLGEVLMSSTYFTRNFNNQNTLYLHFVELKVTGKLSFNSNAANKGAGIFFTNYSCVNLYNDSQMGFANNIAALGGGAIYADYPSSSQWVLFKASDTVNVTFHNNQAHAAGNSIFFNIPVDASSRIIRDPSSERSIMYVPKSFNYSGNNYQDEIATSPYTIALSPPAVCIGESCENGGTYSLSDIMLGENLSVSASMIDYFGNAAEPCLFQIDCHENCDNYSLSGFTEFKYALVHNDTLQNIAIIGNKITDENTTVGLSLSPVLGTVTKEVRAVMVKLEISMYPCRTGYKYDHEMKSCVCNDIPDLVHCEESIVQIKKGYWYGSIGNGVGVGVCPNSYCSYPSCKVTDKFCKLSQTLDDQCYKHRTGTACGECDTNYTLAFDSSDCISTSECQVWWTVLVVIIVILYWIVALFTIISVMYFVKAPTITGYVCGIIYFYSILDLFIGENLIISDGVVQFVAIISGIINLTPRFLSKLCFVKGLSGIDQQFIHYVHPLAISFMLFLISRVARRSPKATAILARAGIVRSTCLLILLFYTSLSSTTLQLLRPLHFHGANGYFTYSSPDIKYFRGRHIVYGIVALVFLFVVVLGLPVFLFLQPFLRRCRRLNFITIIPLLDQFQQCYKLKYHSVAAFYLICRLVIFVILGMDVISFSNRFFALQVVCFLIAMVHSWLQPYKDNKLNSLDEMILLVALMVVSLNIGVPFTSLNANKGANNVVIIILALLPLMLFVGNVLSSVLVKKMPCNKTEDETSESLLRDVNGNFNDYSSEDDE